MTRLMVFGQSDDLIEIREIGRYPDEIIRGGNEFGIYYPSKENPVELHFSDGSILNIWYGERDLGIWGIEVKEQGTIGTPGAGTIIVPAEDDRGIYSDVAFVTAPGLKFVKCIYEGEEVSL
ncbi:MAG: hypothetical protein JXQ82_07845 [Methanomicrobiaceae archaeon]|nr:hypothetical protein [Methanomicrobiaceae archaeon]